MIARSLGIAFAAALVIAAAADGPAGRKSPVPYTSPNQPDRMFHAYCASCHGEHGRGDGPRASTLKTPPPDLTTIAQRTGGHFPAEHVYQTIQGQPILVEVGPTEMPAWGQVFMEVDHNREQVEVRIANLTKYVEALQLKQP